MAIEQILRITAECGSEASRKKRHHFSNDFCRATRADRQQERVRFPDPRAARVREVCAESSVARTTFQLVQAGDQPIIGT